jgi:hypothetical protein
LRNELFLFETSVNRNRRLQRPLRSPAAAARRRCKPLPRTVAAPSSPLLPSPRRRRFPPPPPPAAAAARRRRGTQPRAAQHRFTPCRHIICSSIF